MLDRRAIRATSTCPPKPFGSPGSWPTRTADTGTLLITEGVAIWQRALAADRPGEYQTQSVVAALRTDAQKAEETERPQIVSWYDELVRPMGSPVRKLHRAVAVGEADGLRVGLTAPSGSGRFGASIRDRFD